MRLLAVCTGIDDANKEKVGGYLFGQYQLLLLALFRFIRLAEKVDMV